MASPVDDPRTEEVATELVRTSDGRQLGVCRWGNPDGSPLFVLHGTPGSRFLRHPGTGYVDRRLSVVTYDRPGYGVSTPRSGQTVADAAADIEAVADRLGLGRFGVAGISGGGPRALAAAALLPDRVTRCATVVSGAPFGAAGLDFFAGMSEEDREAWQTWSAGGEAVEAEAAETMEWVRTGMPGLPGDDPEDRAMLQQAFGEAFRQGTDGYAEDHRALVRDWGFALEDVEVPTRVMVARDDSFVPTTHWRWLTDHLPNAELVVVDGNHFGPRSVPEMELMAWTAASAPDDS